MPSLLDRSRTRPLGPCLAPLARLLSPPLALALAGLGVPAVGFAQTPPAPALLDAPADAVAPRVGLRVDTSGLDEGNAGPMGEKIVEASTAAVTDAGFVVSNDPADPRVVVVVEPMGDEENPGFVVGYSLEQADEIIPGSARQSECPLCTRTELVDRIAGDLGPLLALAEDHQADQGGGEVEGPGEPIDEGPPPDTRKIGPLGYAGIGLAVVGLAGVGTGIGLIAKGVEPIADDPAYQRNFAKPGAVALGIGGAALLAGVVVIALDVSKRKRARSGSSSSARVRAHGLGVAF